MIGKELAASNHQHGPDNDGSMISYGLMSSICISLPGSSVLATISGEQDGQSVWYLAR